MATLIIYSNPDHFKAALQRNKDVSWFSNGIIHGIATKERKDSLVAGITAPDRTIEQVAGEVRKQILELINQNKL